MSASINKEVVRDIENRFHELFPNINLESVSPEVIKMAIDDLFETSGLADGDDNDGGYTGGDIDMSCQRAILYFLDSGRVESDDRFESPVVNGTKEIRLKVTADTYKAVTNLLHNEMGLSKEDLMGMIDKVIERIVDKKLDADKLDSIILEAVKGSISRLTTNGWGLNKCVDNAIEKAVGAKVIARVNERLNSITVDKF